MEIDDWLGRPARVGRPRKLTDAELHRPTNENTNGLLRQYLPQGTDLGVRTAEHLTAVAAELHNRPRKVLSWDSPAPRFTKLLLPTG